ncbi:MAG: lysine--tRNA ligase [candidate division WOR-3 bacterium]|jgi:lysyl-tRNA synthetase class 2|nr:lysine--tRNA ligase [candidate division WOR-3 bacterium]MCR4423698.1 lysine--tRNA ligase [candidate division WOR-3 bacterium]MDH7519037.1 lysine--tRNA ligase [bacterium]
MNGQELQPATPTGYEVRMQKLSQLRQEGILPYAYRFERTHYAADVVSNFAALQGKVVSVAGRLVTRRRHGKTQFAHIQDTSGKLQVYLRQDTLGQKVYELLELLDIGDVLGLRGEVFKTKTGEVTVHVQEWQLLAKSLQPLPEKFHGLRDVEMRYRQRYLDLLVNEDSKRVFEMRSKIIRLIRQFLEQRGFIEVETPVLQPIYGGAAARPFQTYYNVLEQEMFLRISDELYLKRLIVGGLERVYEIGKDFRNEGLDRFHNPEFTQMELYQAYADYHDMMTLVEELFKFLAQELYGKTEIEFSGHRIDFGKPWRRLRFVEALQEKIEVNPLELSDTLLTKVAARFGIEVKPGTTRAKLLDKLFSELIQESIVEPTFVMDHPKETTPLAKPHREDDRLVERFEPVVCGLEVGNAFSELNDPLEQRQRFEEAVQRNEEFATLDEDYCRALEYGMPPTGGLGIGIDRLVMLFTNQDSIRDVILFPQLKKGK